MPVIEEVSTPRTFLTTTLKVEVAYDPVHTSPEALAETLAAMIRACDGRLECVSSMFDRMGEPIVKSVLIT